jgi:hypothetical protein
LGGVDRVVLGRLGGVGIIDAVGSPENRERSCGVARCS